MATDASSQSSSQSLRPLSFSWAGPWQRRRYLRLTGLLGYTPGTSL
jgi:hypothetical protein